MWRLIDVLANLFDCSIAILFITRIIDSKRPRNKYKVFVAAMIAILALYIVTTVLNYLYLFEGILGFCYVIIMFAYAFFLLKGSALLSFIYPCFEILLKIVSSIITLFFVKMLLGKGIVSFISENSIEKLIIIIFEKISFFLVLQIVLKIHKKNKWELYFLEWMWILFVYIISFIIYCCIFRVTLITNGSLLRDILICCIIVGLIAINGVVYYFVTNISKRNIEILRYSIMSLRLEQQESGLEEIKREYFEVRKIRHDMSNILLTGIELIRQHKYQEAEQYFDEFVENKLKEVPPIIVTESEIITALLNVKIARCKEENIRIRYQVLGDLKRVEEIDLGILLGNLLDNSIEASKKIDCKEKREICLSIENYKGYLRVIVKNTIAESILTRNPLLCSTKSDKVKHGFGIFSIKEIVNKNNGCLDIYEEGGYFVALILL